MPVSGRPTKAALLKITHGSSTPAVKGRQNEANGPVWTALLGAARADSDAFRFQSRVPRATRERTRAEANKISKTRQRRCTLSTVTGSGDSRGGTTCGWKLTTLGSKVR